MEALFKLLRKYPTNEQFLDAMSRADTDGKPLVVTPPRTTSMMKRRAGPRRAPAYNKVHNRGLWFDGSRIEADIIDQAGPEGAGSEIFTGDARSCGAFNNLCILAYGRTIHV
jgi:hypothetical protein